MPSEIWQIWLAALITLGIYTYLFSDNKVYRFLLNVMTGLGVGYNLIITWKQVLGPLWWDPMSKGLAALFGGKPGGAGAFWLLVGLLGTLWYFQFSRKHLWLSRIVIGMTLGAGAGVVFKNELLKNAPQITDSFRPILAAADGTSLLDSTGPVEVLPSFLASLNNFIFVATIVCVMVYFFFSFSHDRPVVRRTAKMGRWLLMISFGAFFGNAIMTRMAIFLERVKFLANDWARNREVMTWPWVLGAIGLVLAIAAIYFFTTPRPKPPSVETAPEEVTSVLGR